MKKEELLEIWIETYASNLTRIAYTYVRDWAASQDLVQDSFITAYEKMEQLRNPIEPFPWLAQITINKCKMAQRKFWREIVMSLLPDRMGASAEQTYFRLAEDQTLYDSVLSLPEVFREPIILFYFEDLSVDEISRILGIRKGTVKSRLSRGRKKISNLWEERNYGENSQGCQTTI